MNITQGKKYESKNYNSPFIGESILNSLISDNPILFEEPLKLSEIKALIECRRVARQHFTSLNSLEMFLATCLSGNASIEEMSNGAEIVFCQRIKSNFLKILVGNLRYFRNSHTQEDIVIYLHENILFLDGRDAGQFILTLDFKKAIK